MKMLSYTLMILAAAAVMTSPSDAVSDVISVSRSHRARRQSATRLKPEQQKEVLDRHNTLRALEGASNMELMSWNDSLAELAANWSEGCLWKNANAEENPEYKNIGQNLFIARQEGSLNLTYAIQRWYGEKGYFTYETASCEVQSCGHYMQVVWAITTHVGCAYQTCHPLNESGFTGPAKFLVCNYSPADIYVGDKPYSKGAACSKCPRGAGWCSKKLCNNKCSTRGDDCPWSSCAVVCYNCATIDQQTCRCSCADGWT